MFLILSIALLALLIAITFLWLLCYFGYFRKVQINTGSPSINFSNKTFAYKSFCDNFSGIGFQFTKLHNLTAVQSAEIRKKFSKAFAVGIYYDNPYVEREKCKFSVGLLLNEDSDCEDIKKVLRDNDFKFATMPDVDHVVYTYFPFKGSISIPIALKAVYPNLAAYNEEKRLCAYPYMEFYTTDEIHFILPLAKQDDFFFYYENNDDKKSEASGSDTEVEACNETLDNDFSDEDNEDNVSEISNSYKNKKSTKMNLRRNSSTSNSSFDELTLDESGINVPKN